MGQGLSCAALPTAEHWEQEVVLTHNKEKRDMRKHEIASKEAIAKGLTPPPPPTSNPIGHLTSVTVQQASNSNGSLQPDYCTPDASQLTGTHTPVKAPTQQSSPPRRKSFDRQSPPQDPLKDPAQQEGSFMLPPRAKPTAMRPLADSVTVVVAPKPMAPSEVLRESQPEVRVMSGVSEPLPPVVAPVRRDTPERKETLMPSRPLSSRTQPRALSGASSEKQLHPQLQPQLPHERQNSGSALTSKMHPSVSLRLQIGGTPRQDSASSKRGGVAQSAEDTPVMTVSDLRQVVPALDLQRHPEGLLDADSNSVPPSPISTTSTAGQPSLLQSLLVGRTLGRHRVVDIDLLPPPPTGLQQSAEDESLNVVGGHSRRSTWNPATASQHFVTPSGLHASARLPNGQLLPSSPVSNAHHTMSLVRSGSPARSASPAHAPQRAMNLNLHHARLRGDSPVHSRNNSSHMSPAASPKHSIIGGAALVVDELASARALSPRINARMTHSASIAATLARQRASGAMGISPALNATITDGSYATTADDAPFLTASAPPLLSLDAPLSASVAPVLDVSSVPAVPLTAASTAASPSTLEVSQQESRRGLVLNDRRRQTMATEIGAAQRFPSPTLPTANTDGANAPRRSSLGVHPASATVMPLSPTGAAHASRRSTRSVSRGKKMALIIDANTLTQRLTSVALYRTGFTACDVATTGESGVEMARVQQYDLIVLQTHLTESMSGVDAARAIRTFEDRSGDVPSTIVALTTAIDAASLAAYESARISAVIQSGAVISEVVPDALETLSLNSNFLFVNMAGVKTQSMVQNPIPMLSSSSMHRRSLGFSSTPSRRNTHRLTSTTVGSLAIPRVASVAAPAASMVAVARPSTLQAEVSQPSMH